MFDAKGRLDGFQKGVGTLIEGMPESINNFFGFINATQKEGALTVREKELIAIGVSIYTGVRIASLYTPRRLFRQDVPGRRFWKRRQWLSFSAAVLLWALLPPC